MIQLHLPVPPSTNRLWRSIRSAGGKSRRVKVIKSDEYQDWIKQTDQLVMASTQLRGHRTIDGPFHAEICIDRSKVNGNSDLDNRTKALIDAAQRWHIVSNDKNLVSLSVMWGATSAGCILTISEAA